MGWYSVWRYSCDSGRWTSQSWSPEVLLDSDMVPLPANRNLIITDILASLTFNAWWLLTRTIVVVDRRNWLSQWQYLASRVLAVPMQHARLYRVEGWTMLTILCNCIIGNMLRILWRRPWRNSYDGGTYRYWGGHKKLTWTCYRVIIRKWSWNKGCK